MCSIDGKVHNSVPISRYTGISATINQISLLPTVADTYASDVATSIKIFILYVLHSCDLSKEKRTRRNEDERMFGEGWEENRRYGVGYHIRHFAKEKCITIDL